MGTGIFASTARFYIHDHLYSPVALTDYSGSILERCEYDAYGNTYILDAQYAPRTTSNYGNPYLFTGRRMDYLDSGSLKIQYNRNRYYDYYTGRWLTHDPLGYLEGMNLYEFASSNPVTYVDPMGTFYVIPGVHQKISNKAYSESGLTFRSSWMLPKWVNSNVSLDIPPEVTDKAYHCLNSSFVNKVQKLMGKIKTEECPKGDPHDAGARCVLTYMGRMSHILQDCMAHTDWVEGNNEDMRNWYKKVETETVTIWIPPSVVSITTFKYSQSIRDKAGEFYTQSAGHESHSTGLDLTQLSSDASNLFYFTGTGIPGLDSLHNLFATDASGHGRDKAGRVPGSYKRAENSAVAQTTHILSWSHDNMKLCCRCAIFK